MKFEVSQKAVLYDPGQKKFLFMKYSGEQAKDKAWSLVGGRMEDDENPISALKREINEELGGVEYEIVRAISTYVSNGTCRVGYLVYYKGGEITLSDEHEEFKWLSKEEIEKEKDFHPGVEQFIGAALEVIQFGGYLNDLQRLQADFENYKKRMAAGQAELSAHLTRGIVTDLIPILDNFHAAITHVPKESEGSPWVTGITYIEKQFEDVLANYGVKPIDVKVGDQFDPTKHEALSHQDESGIKNQELGNDVVAQVVQKGYAINSQVVRPAKVIVKNHHS